MEKVEIYRVMNDSVPLVSICLITYNHAKYIRQAVDSILNQRMNFTYELLIADDASTDNTQQILKENYSGVENVRLILREKNIKGKNAYLALREARGKYIYCCEGDDFWVGTDGLQTLVDWLEEHKEYVGVCGRRITLSERTGAKSVTYDKATNNRELSLDDFLSGKSVFDWCTTLFKNFLYDGKYDYRFYLAHPIIGDVTLCLYVLLHGKIFQLDKVVGIYRTDRIKGAGSYNALNTPKMIFQDHIMLLLNLEQLIGEKLNYLGLKRKYSFWYINSMSSTSEFIRQIPYIRQKVGIKITIDCIKKWIKRKISR